MTEQDWDDMINQHKESLDAEYTRDPLAKFKSEYLIEPAKPKTGEGQIFRFIRIEKQTAKAKFYVTHETMTEVQGFWCPNAAATMRDTDIVEVAHWCTIKVIQFI